MQKKGPSFSRPVESFQDRIQLLTDKELGGKTSEKQRHVLREVLGFRLKQPAKGLGTSLHRAPG